MMKGMAIPGLISLTVLLIGCGGGGGSSSDNDEPEEVQRVSLTGVAVKGPMAGADVNLYSVKWSEADLKGDLISSGTTDSTSAVTGVQLDSSYAGQWVLVEFSANAETIDLNTGAYPVLTQLQSIASADDILAGESVYATALTSLALQLAIDNADTSNPYIGNGDGNISEEEFSHALTIASGQVVSTFGFGLPAGFDLYDAVPLVTDETDTDEELASVVAYRQATEGLAVVISEITNSLLDGSSSMDQVLGALSADLTDGDIDGQSSEGVIAAFSTVSSNDLQTVVTEDVSDKLIPGTNKTVGDIEDLLVSETSDTGTTQSTESISSGSVSSSPEAAKVVSDIDGDGVADSEDAFPEDPNEWQDSDGDGVGDNSDAFPQDSSEWADTDKDGVGDNADAFPNDPKESKDSDGDGVGDNSDAFVSDPEEWIDSDGDGVGDNSDAFPNDSTESKDSDGDNVGDNADAFPNDASEWLDSDGDGVGDNSDAFPNDSTESKDSDGDKVGDNSDAFINDPTEWQDSDGDGVGDNSDAFPDNQGESQDTDSDGIGDNADNCPTVANTGQGDADEDGIGDACDDSQQDSGVWDNSNWDEASWQ